MYSYFPFFALSLSLCVCVCVSLSLSLLEIIAIGCCSRKNYEYNR